MHSKLFLFVRGKVFCAVVLSALVVSLGAAEARAQSEELKFEAGGHATLLHTDARNLFFVPSPIVCVRAPCVPLAGFEAFAGRRAEPGFGGRFGYNFTRHVAAEAEFNLFPRDRVTAGGRKVQGLFGVKAGRRFERVGVFGKARPGFLRLSRGDFRPRPDTVCIAQLSIFPPPAACFESVGRTSFAFDAGGVLEFYPSRRVVVRVDAGDTIVRLGERRVAVARDDAPRDSVPASAAVVPVARETTHNFQGSVGVGFRF